MLSRLLAEMEQATTDADVCAVVITGAGERAFCAGADREELARRDWRAVLNLESAEVFARISACPCVTLAAINGAACGGGLELALACDIRIAAEQARFGFPEPELGLIPAAGGTQRLADVVGKAKAKELILGGAVWDAAEALRCGLVSEVVPLAELPAAIERWVDRIARRDPTALRLAKQAMDLESSHDAGFRFERVAQALLDQLRTRKHDET